MERGIAIRGSEEGANIRDWICAMDTMCGATNK
jgi:hypothetical protein